MRILLPLLQVLLLAVLPAVRGAVPAGEERFDPPLQGAWLGITGRSGAGGILVDRVEPRSAAAEAGLLAGDRIDRVDGSGDLEDYDAFARAVAALRPLEPADLAVLRGGQRKVLTVRPDPSVLRDQQRILQVLRGSPFLRSQGRAPTVLEEIEGAVPQAIRRARKTSEAHAILNGAVGRLGTSHTAYLPPWTYRNLFASERDGKDGFWMGLILEPVDGPAGPRHFAREILDGGPAALAGLLVGDEIVAVNGIPCGLSPRRILAGFEAARPGLTVRIEQGERVLLEIRREPGGPSREIPVEMTEPLDALRATEASIRLLRREGRTVACLHLWNLMSPGVPRVLAQVLSDRARYAEGVVVDLRGRGGQVGIMSRVVGLLKADRRPLAILIDRETRSAKEIAAWQLRGFPTAVLVGERTAGAVLPSTVVELPSGAAFMYPVDPQGISQLTGGEVLEGRGVPPDLEVPRPGPYAMGRDPILEAGIGSVLDRLRDLPRRRRL